MGRIEDRRDHPSFGHDFRSFSSESEERFIEVKCVGKVEDGHRFFLSENERETTIMANGNLHVDGRALRALEDGADIVTIARAALANPALPHSLASVHR